MADQDEVNERASEQVTQLARELSAFLLERRPPGPTTHVVAAMLAVLKGLILYNPEPTWRAERLDQLGELLDNLRDMHDQWVSESRATRQ